MKSIFVVLRSTELRGCRRDSYIGAYSSIDGAKKMGYAVADNNVEQFVELPAGVPAIRSYGGLDWEDGIDPASVRTLKCQDGSRVVIVEFAVAS